MAEIFLSYKREQKEKVRAIAEAFGRRGRSVFWDARLRASADYIQKINAELSAANCVVVAWCSKSIRSPWVLAECMKAFHKRNLLPVKIESFDENDIPAPF